MTQFAFAGYLTVLIYKYANLCIDCNCRHLEIRKKQDEKSTCSGGPANRANTLFRLLTSMKM